MIYARGHHEPDRLESQTHLVLGAPQVFARWLVDQHNVSWLALSHLAFGPSFMDSENMRGISGNTAADLREVAEVWAKSADYCDECGEPELASRDRRFASAMREAASILEALRMDS